MDIISDILYSSRSETHLTKAFIVTKDRAVLTTFASARISAPIDDVFAVMLNYKDYGKWSCFQQHKWQAEVDVSGAPPVGTKGSVSVSSHLFDSCAPSPSPYVGFEGPGNGRVSRANGGRPLAEINLHLLDRRARVVFHC